MEVAFGSAKSLLGKVLTTLSDGLVAAYVDSLQLGHNSEQIRDKLLHTQGLLHNAQGSHAGDNPNPGLQGLLEKLSRDADQAEDLLDEVHYFQIHDKLHGTLYATTQEAGHQALHAGTALRHTLGSLVHFFSCSRTPKTKRDGGSDAAAAVTGRVTKRSKANSATAHGQT
uniref:Rx N-terminal domain-containing protein n=1 Tax=Aegilops tauschii subsp. strangulata TaxID=200361 RepID=A0A453JB36_AEGTS